MNVNDIIFGHEFFCVGGVTIHGVIGIRDFDEMITLDAARLLYIKEVKWLKNYLQLTLGQLLTETFFRRNGVYKGKPLYLLELEKKKREEKKLALQKK